MNCDVMFFIHSFVVRSSVRSVGLIFIQNVHFHNAIGGNMCVPEPVYVPTPKDIDMFLCHDARNILTQSLMFMSVHTHAIL